MTDNQRIKRTANEILGELEVPPDFKPIVDSKRRFRSAYELLDALEGSLEFEELMNWNPIKPNEALLAFIAQVSHLADLEGAQAIADMEAHYSHLQRTQDNQSHKDRLKRKSE